MSKERFLVEMEKCFVKIRWHKRDEDTKEKDDIKEETDEEKRVRELSEVEAARSRMIFDPDGGDGCQLLVHLLPQGVLLHVEVF